MNPKIIVVINHDGVDVYPGGCSEQEVKQSLELLGKCESVIDLLRCTVKLLKEVEQKKVVVINGTVRIKCIER